jgi:hypothetical protein
MIGIQCVIVGLGRKPVPPRNSLGIAVGDVPADALIVGVLKLRYPTFLVPLSHDTMSDEVLGLSSYRKIVVGEFGKK